MLRTFRFGLKTTLGVELLGWQLPQGRDKLGRLGLLVVSWPERLCLSQEYEGLGGQWCLWKACRDSTSWSIWRLVFNRLQPLVPFLFQHCAHILFQYAFLENFDRKLLDAAFDLHRVSHCLILFLLFLYWNFLYSHQVGLFYVTLMKWKLLYWY